MAVGKGVYGREWTSVKKHAWRLDLRLTHASEAEEKNAGNENVSTEQHYA